MKKFLSTLGVISLLLLTGCDSSGGDESGGTTSAYPFAPSGNYKLLPGYQYDCDRNTVYEMFVKERGNVIFLPTPLDFLVFDENYNDYSTGDYSNSIFTGKSYTFDAGHYYITPRECAEKTREKTFYVQSNVLE